MKPTNEDAGRSVSPLNMPRRRPPEGMGREVFQSFARADGRTELLEFMRAQAEEYFGCKVQLREASAQPAPVNSGARYQGSAKWTPRPEKEVDHGSA